MTLYVALHSATGIREDICIFSKNRGEYGFYGFTMTKDKFVPNTNWFSHYYALGSKQGIGFWEDGVALVENGNITHTISFAPNEIPRYPSWHVFPETTDILERIPPQNWSAWNEIKLALQNLSPRQEAAQTILSAMEEWETVSYQTLRQAKETMEKQTGFCNATEIFVSGHQWLWYNRPQGIMAIGYKDQLWGSVSLPSRETIVSRGATPVREGWFIDIGFSQKYLLLQSDRGVEARRVIAPYTKWEQEDYQWRYWSDEHALLTPAGCLVSIPQRSLLLSKTSKKWASFSVYPVRSEVTLMNQQGEFFVVDLSRYGDVGSKCLGNQSMLIVHTPNDNERYLSLISLRPKAFQHCWQIGFFSSIGDSPFHYIRAVNSKTDLYVLFLRPLGKNDVGLCFIDAQGRFWQPRILFHDLYFETRFSAIDEKGQSAIVLPKQFGEAMTDRIIIKASGGWVYMYLGPGVSLSGKMAPFPKDGSFLWDHLAPLWETHS